MVPTYMTLHNNSPKVDMTLPINASLLTISGSVFEEKLQLNTFQNLPALTRAKLNYHQLHKKKL